MKLYLDDVRKAPQNWIPVRNVLDAIQLLDEQEIKEISLDHDLGNGHLTGLDLINQIEKEVIERNFKPPKMYVHSMNPVGRKQMLVVIKRIEAIIN